MANPINPSCKCQLVSCGKFTGSSLVLYCNLKHREAAKLLRRKARASGEAVAVAKPGEAVEQIFYPDSDPESLELVAKSILDGGPSPVWFKEASVSFDWQAPEGIKWTVGLDGLGKLEKI